MKKLSIPWIIVSILVAIIIIVLAVVIQKQRTAFVKAMSLVTSDFTPAADTPEPANEIEALRIISPENHTPDICDSFEHHPEEIKFYQRQLKALVYVGKHQIKAAIPDLILYLDYPTSFIEAALKDPGHGPETDRAKKVWPAFGALLEIPGSGEAVRDYCLDPVHPMRYRLTAFVILRYIDPSLVEPCWKALGTQGIKGFQNAFDPIQNKRLTFWGMQSSGDQLEYGR